MDNYLENYGICWEINILNTLIKCQDWLNHHTEPKFVHKSYISGLISEVAKIGSFWPFLATFGIEIVTRWWKLVFKYLKSLKTIYTSTVCWCNIHATLIFQDSYLGKTQKLSFLLNSSLKNFNFYKFQSGLAYFWSQLWSQVQILFLIQVRLPRQCVTFVLHTAGKYKS